MPYYNTNKRHSHGTPGLKNRYSEDGYNTYCSECSVENGRKVCMIGIEESMCDEFCANWPEGMKRHQKSQKPRKKRKAGMDTGEGKEHVHESD